MAQRNRPQAETLSGSPQPNFTGYSTSPIISKRSPTSSDTGYPLGQQWVNKVSGNAFQLTQVAAGSATWVNTGVSPSGSVDTLTGDTGGAISPSAGNINILGGTGLTVDGSGNTLTINRDASDGFPITPYVVGPIGQAGYQTVQAGINAAHAASGGAVYIQPGTYTENLTLYDKVDLVGAVANADVTIIGTHTPPTSGNVNIGNLTFQSATNVFSSAASGTTNITLTQCFLNVTNGYTFNLANWTGTINTFDLGSIGTNDGFINNTAGAQVLIYNATVGNGTANPMTISGANIIYGSQINCPITIQGSSTTNISGGSEFLSTITTAGTASINIYDTEISTGSSTAISHGSSVTLLLGSVAINSSANPIISGTGPITFGEVTYLNGKNIISTITQTYASSIARVTPYVVGSTGNFSTIQKAIDAAHQTGINETVIVQPGSYTESLTLYDKIDIRGEIYSGVTITGVHTPPASGSVTFQNLTLTSATHILSSAVAGTTTIAIEDCVLTVTNGYVFNLANWTGTLLIDDSGSNGTNDGVVNNTGGATVKLTDCTVGAGTGQTFTYSGGSLILEGVVLSAPITIGTGATLTARLGTVFLKTLTTANNSIADVEDCIFSTGATAAISHGSSGVFTLAETAITSSNNPAIAGSGAGVMTLAGVSFLSNSLIAGTLTTVAGVIRGGNFISQYVVGTSPDAKYQTIQSAITAAAAAGGSATVIVKPGTYTENLTLSSTVDIRGEIFSGVTITGVHTPPSSGRVTFQNLTLTSATHILSSVVAGTTVIIIEDCTITVTNGYVFNLLNWTGGLFIDDSGSNGTNDGVVNNTGGSSIKITDSTIGAGTGNTFTYSGGSLTLEGVVLSSPITIGTGSTLTARLGTVFLHTLTTANNSIADVEDCIFSTGATAAISHGSSGTFTLLITEVTSSNNPAIAGSGAGVMTLGDITFLSNSTIAGTLTTAWATTKTGAFTSSGAFTIASGTGAITISDDAAATTVKLGTGAAAKTVVVGSVNTTSTTTINGGPTGSVSIVGSGGTIGIANDAAANVVTIGSTTASAATTLQAGSGTTGLKLNAAGNVQMVPATNSAAGLSVTLNARVGQATFTGQTTASGATDVYTISNSVISGTTQAIMLTCDNLGSNDAQMTITRIQQSASTIAVSLKNNGAAALNGDVHLTFWILN